MFFEIKDLCVNSAEGTPILEEISLSVSPGEIHVIMGPNGSGKSTLTKALGGHPGYEVTRGEVIFEDTNLLELDPEERVHRGCFMSFQYPLEVPGVSNFQLLHSALNAKRKFKELPPLPIAEFEELLNKKMAFMAMKEGFKYRNVNEGFSGGEKKKNEILQMAVLDPKLAILDETDSGLDIDALKVVADGINHLMNPEKGLILITHYQRLLNYITPHKVHVLIGGKIVRSGGAELALELEEKGYDWLAK